MNGRRGTVRFQPYFKVEYWHPVDLTWRPIQRSHLSAEAARVAPVPPAATAIRVYEVSAPGARGRRIVAELPITS